MVVTTRLSESAQREQTNNDVLGRILAAIEGLTQTSAVTQNIVQEVIQILPRIGGGNGASSSAGIPHTMPNGNLDGVQSGGVFGGDLRGPALNPAPPVQEPIAPPPADDNDKYTVEKFKKNGAEPFIGGTNVLKAENLIDITEKAFRALQVPLHHKTRLSVCMLQGEASYWWKSLERTTFSNRQIDTISWEEFKYSFNKHYFPESMIQQKKLAFNNLRQNNDSVRDFAHKFLELERFSESLANEKARADKFFWGLKFELQDKIATIPRNTLTEVIDAATAQELVSNQEKFKKQERGTLPQKQNPQAYAIFKQIEHPYGGSNNSKRKRDDYRQPLKCRNCDKNHFGRCTQPTKCFNCGRIGHLKKDCRFPLQNKHQEKGKMPMPPQIGATSTDK